jgi:hypothetical protein
VLRLDEFVGVARTIRALSEGSETAIVAVHISAVHQKSNRCQICSEEEFVEDKVVTGMHERISNGLTASCIVNIVIAGSVHKESCQTDNNRDKSEGEHSA